jgi:hypothetical protein
MAERRFETRLARDLVEFADLGMRPVDERALAEDLVALGRRPRILSIVPRVRVVLVAAVLLMLLAVAIALVAGIVAPRLPLGTLAFIRSGDLWTAGSDGSNARLRASGDRSGGRSDYLYVRWSPDGRYLAAVRDTGDVTLVPAIELFDDAGHRLWTEALDPGGLPDISWAPDSQRLAVAAFPAVMPSGGEALTSLPRDIVTPMAVSILGVDRSKGVLNLKAAAPPFVRPADKRAGGWIEPWIRWSPVSDLIALKTLGSTCCDPELWVFSSEGTNRRQLAGAEAGVAPAWFGWRAGGGAIDILGLGSETTCPGGRIIAGVCRSGYWTSDTATGTLTFTPLPTVPSGSEPQTGCTAIAWSVDRERVAVALSSVQGGADPETIRGTSILGIVNPAAPSMTVVASGTWSGDNGRGVPISVTGEVVEPHLLLLSSDGGTIFRLGIVPGQEGGWAIRSGPTLGGGPSTSIANAVTQFDFAVRP